MTKHTIHFFFLSILTIVLFSCSKDWLDEKTSVDIAKPTTLKDFQALLDNVNSGNFGSMNTNTPGLGQIASDDSYVTDEVYETRADYEKNAYLWKKEFPYLLEPDWLEAYARIFICNLVLDEIKHVNPESELERKKKNDIIGQALFSRSNNYYELSQIWSPPLTPDVAEKPLGIPLRLESDINIPSTRSTVKEMYDQITNDLLKAKDLLPVTAQYRTRGCKQAVFALLARVHLNIGQYAKAKAFSDSCLIISSDLLNFNDLNVTASFPVSLFNTEVIFHSTMYNHPTIGSRGRIDPIFVSTYSDSDLRKKAFFGTSASLVTFKGNYTGTSTRFTGLSINEQYLIRAECNARGNKVADAMTDLNTLLKSRWDLNAAYIDVTAIDAEDALHKVLLERRKELLMRGLRWSDLRRLNQDPRFATTITRTVNGQTYTLEPNSYKYTFPIPDDIIQITGIQQNPGWEK